MKLKASVSQTGRWSITFAALTAAAGIALSLAVRARMADTEAEAAQRTADTLRQHTEQELNLFVDVLESVCALHAISGEISQAAMDEFIEKGLVHQHEVLGAFGLTQQISPQLRTAIESKEKSGPGAYTVVQKSPDGDWVPAARRPVYYPLTWQNRIDALQVPIGFDFGAAPANRAIISRIQRTRKTQMVPSPIRDQRSETGDPNPDVRSQKPDSTRRNEGSSLTSDLRPLTSDSPAYWVLAPVIPRDAPEFVIGFAVAKLHPQQILDKVSRLSVHSPQLILTPSAAPLQTSTRFTGNAWITEIPFDAVGTQWIFKCSLPVPASERRSTAALLFGLVVTGLMTILLLLLAGRTRRIEAEVHARTEDLSVANRQLEENIQERAQMEEEMNELAAREQRRIGRDLHDSLGQKLTGAVFLSRSLLNWFEKQGVENRGWKTEDKKQNSEVRSQKSVSSNIPQSTSRNAPSPATRHSPLDIQTTHAQTLNDTLKEAVSQVRNMARGLASVTLNEESLEESLEQLADEISSVYDTDCTVKLSGPLPDLNRKTKEQLYFIAREAVNNAAKHANPNRIVIRLTGMEAGWTLQIEDDGTGLPEDRPAGKGMGLRIMKHRAVRIGAQFRIESSARNGTLVGVTNHHNFF